MSTASVSRRYADDHASSVEQDAQSGDRQVVETGLWLPMITLWRREMVRFFRQRSQVIGAIGTPLVFWILLGLGLNGNFVMPGQTGWEATHHPGAGLSTSAEGSAMGAEQAGRADQHQAGDSSRAGVSGNMGYLAYFFPGTVVLMVVFTAVFTTFGVIEDRREGFLQAVLGSPAPRLGVVLGKVLGGASIATVQGLLFLVVWPLVSPWPGWGQMVAAAAVLFGIAFGLTALCLSVGWSMRSTAGFHGVINMVLMPMWFLCGAVFPLASAWPIRYLMYADPLTYGYSAFASLLSTPNHVLTHMPLVVSLPIMGGFLALALGGSVLIATRDGA